MKSTELPAVKLLLLILGASFLFFSVKIEIIPLLVLSVLSLIFGLLFTFYQYRTAAYLLWAFTAGLIIANKFDTQSIGIPNKIIPGQSGIFKGEITELVKADKKYLRYFAKGELNTENLPAIEETGILLTVFSPKFALLPGDKFQADVNVSFQEGSMPDSKFDYGSYLSSNELSWSVTASGWNIIPTYESPNRFTANSYFLRDGIKKRVFKLFDSTSAGVMTALITGDKSMLSQEIRESFSLSGTAHLLAVSGLHVVLISFIIFTLFSFVSNQWLKTFIIITCVMFFVYITGFLPSAQRAAFMISVFLLSQNFEQKVHPLNSLALTVLIMLVINPDVIFSMSYQMSVLSVAGIILFYQKIHNLFGSWKDKNFVYNFIAGSLSMSLSATIFITPMISYYFGVYTVVSPIVNLFAVPLIMLAHSFGLCALFFSYLSFDIAELFASTASLFINITDSINRFAISYEFANISGKISIYISIFVSLFLIYFVFAKNYKQRLFRFTFSLAGIFFVYFLAPVETKPDLSIIPKENLTAMLLKGPQCEYLLLFERNSGNKFRQDIEIKNYIKNSDKQLSVAYSGNSGISTIDAVKKEKKFEYFEIDNFIQKKIAKLLKIKNHPVKIIEIEK